MSVAHIITTGRMGTPYVGPSAHVVDTIVRALYAQKTSDQSQHMAVGVASPAEVRTLRTKLSCRLALEVLRGPVLRSSHEALRV